MNLVVFFTYGVSLKNWEERGHLHRELHFYNELQKRNIKVTFITYGDIEDKTLEKELGGISIVPLYEKISKPKSKYIRFVKSLYLPFLCRNVLKQADLLKTNQIWGGWIAVIAKLLWGKPLLVRCGYEAYQHILKRNKRSFRRYILLWSSWLTYRSADHVLLSTDEISDFVQKNFGISASKITVRQNWIDTVQFAPKGEVKNLKNHVLFVGRLSAEKNFPLLLKATQGCNWDIDIVGAGDLRDSFELYARKLGVQTSFLGRFSNNRMAEIYNQYPVYVLCSQYEGNPKTLLEAMACECAVVGTDVSGIREILRHDKTGLLVEEDPDSLRVAIQRLLSDQNLRQKLGQHARRHIIVNNSLESALKNESSIYNNLVKT
jgi:glycosyltransferase involved in cell wall biosynthesis